MYCLVKSTCNASPSINTHTCNTLTFVYGFAHRLIFQAKVKDLEAALAVLLEEKHEATKETTRLNDEIERLKQKLTDTADETGRNILRQI